jgi:hypothetical protein
VASEQTDNGSSTQPTETIALSRKNLLYGAGVGAGALVLGGALATSPALARMAAPSRSTSGRRKASMSSFIVLRWGCPHSTS